jgi:hypothetical protein
MQLHRATEPHDPHGSQIQPHQLLLSTAISRPAAAQNSFYGEHTFCIPYVNMHQLIQHSLGAVLVAEHDLLHAVDPDAASKAQPTI